jgi:hypothetical protein
VVETNADKAEVLCAQFFLPKPAVSAVPTQPTYPKPAWKFEPPTDSQILQAFKGMKRGKATMPGTVPNDVLNICADLLAPYIGPIYRATFILKDYPAAFSTTNTIVFWKPGKDNYSDPNAWRPIVLSNGWGRGLNATINADLMARCELHKILPANHFGGRPGRSTADSLQTVVSITKNAWRAGDVVSFLLLDIKGAFPSVDIPMLLHDMRMQRIPREITDWLRRRFSQRKTTLLFDNFVSEVFNVANGLDQGDPLSQLLYILYNAALF